MILYTVQPEDNIRSIANFYGIPTARLIEDNGLISPTKLVPGQTIVIAYPKQQHIVREGDTLGSIMQAYSISFMQLIRNNPFLFDRKYIYPGETLVIQYETGRELVTNGFTYPYINLGTLKKTLPYLTYLSIFNYRAGRQGEVTQYQDDSAIIQLAKDFGVVPLMMVATLTSKGEPNIEIGYELLLNEELLERNINNTIGILKAKGYRGVNMVLSYISISNQNLYKNLITKVSNALKKEGFLYYITINPSTSNISDLQGVDLSGIEQLVDGITLMRFVWGTNTDPPAAVNSMDYVTDFLKLIFTYIHNDKLAIGIPTIGYEWELPYISGLTTARSLTIDSALVLAYDVNSTIQFDAASQSAFFNYQEFSSGYPTDYIVWFNDARYINAVLQLISENGLNGTGIWNIMVFYTQLWLLINSQYEIVKLLEDNLQ